MKLPLSAIVKMLPVGMLEKLLKKAVKGLGENKCIMVTMDDETDNVQFLIGEGSVENGAIVFKPEMARSLEFLLGKMKDMKADEIDRETDKIENK